MCNSILPKPSHPNHDSTKAYLLPLCTRLFSLSVTVNTPGQCASNILSPCRPASSTHILYHSNLTAAASGTVMSFNNQHIPPASISWQRGRGGLHLHTVTNTVWVALVRLKHCTGVSCTNWAGPPRLARPKIPRGVSQGLQFYTLLQLYLHVAYLKVVKSKNWQKDLYKCWTPAAVLRRDVDIFPSVDYIKAINCAQAHYNEGRQGESEG